MNIKKVLGNLKASKHVIDYNKKLEVFFVKSHPAVNDRDAAKLVRLVEQSIPEDSSTKIEFTSTAKRAREIGNKF